MNIITHNNLDEGSRDTIYEKSDFKLLLSLDHSECGFYEGFGLAVVEASKFGTPSVVLNTGGLPENVHHKKTGWVLESISKEEVEDFYKYIIENYSELSIACHEHNQY